MPKNFLADSLTGFSITCVTRSPHHMPSSSLQKEYQTFCELLIGDKNQIKGSDARLYAIKLAQFSQSKYEEGVLNDNIGSQLLIS
jgi:hypothetical protein